MRSLLYILILLVITGCSFTSAQPRVFEEAERLMHTDPAAALSKLNGVDISEFQDSAIMARWALLYSEAMVANRLTAPTDTIVNIAIVYYGCHNLQDEYQKASRLKALIKSSPENDALATALYLQKEKEFMLYKERVKHATYMYISLLVMMLAVVVILCMRQRMKIQGLQNETLIAEASALKNSVQSGKDDVSRLQSNLNGLLDSRFALIDSLCQTYYETQGTKAEQKAIVDKVKKEIESIRTDSMAEMEQVVNNCKDNILVRVRESYPNIKNEDFQLLVYLASGLSSRTISLLLGESIDVVYKRKSRLKARLKSVPAAILPQVMSIF